MWIGELRILLICNNSDKQKNPCAGTNLEKAATPPTTPGVQGPEKSSNLFPRGSVTGKMLRFFCFLGSLRVLG
jgi:hypothetical protein